MKRVLCVALLLSLLAVPLSGAAEVDLSAMPSDQLQALYVNVFAEMIKREDITTTVAPGIYTVGQEIPAGTYRVTLADSRADVYVFRSKADADLDNYSGRVQDYMLMSIDTSWASSLGQDYAAAMGTITAMYATEIGSLVISDGQAVRIESGSVVFCKIK